ncbi:MAG: four helix bundle protein [Ferruginibacter sp.]
MFLQLNHQKLEVYKATREFVKAAYQLTKLLPNEEKFNLISQVGRAALSVHLNLAEGSSRKSISERKRFFEISRSSVVEVDTALEVIYDLHYCTMEDMEILGVHLLHSFKLLTLLINKS